MLRLSRDLLIETDDRQNQIGKPQMKTARV